MNKRMCEDLVRILKKDLGESASVEEVVKHLEKVGAIWDSSASYYVMGTEFFRILAEPKIRSANSIERELGERYGYDHSTVRRARTLYRRNVVNRHGDKK